jgi:YbbR domain-containing protein
MARQPAGWIQRTLLLIKGALFENLGLKLFSFLIALLLWAFVLGAEDVTTSEDIQIYFKVPENKVLVSDVPSQIKVTVKGPWAAIKSWNPENLKKAIDLSDFDLGLSVVYFEETLFDLPQSLKVVRITPNKWEVILAKKAFKTVPLVQIPTGEPADGYAITAITTNPKEIAIDGPESDLEFLAEIVTEPVSVEGAKESFTTTTKPSMELRNIKILDPAPIQVTVIVKKDLIEKTFTEIPVKVINSDHFAQVKPGTIPITISGPRKVIESLGTNAITAFVDARKEEGDIARSETTREVEFGILPPDVKIRAGTYTVKLILGETKKPPQAPTPSPEPDEQPVQP